MKLLDSKAMSEKIVEILENKKAKDINVIDIHNITIMSDYFVICTGTSTTHIRSLADELIEEMGKLGHEVAHSEGYDSARWILLDFGQVVVHIFHQEERNFYNLERLWSDGVMTYRGTDK